MILTGSTSVKAKVHMIPKVQDPDGRPSPSPSPSPNQFTTIGATNNVGNQKDYPYFESKYYSPTDNQVESIEHRCLPT